MKNTQQQKEYYQEEYEEPFVDEPEVIATSHTIQLTCTLAAMSSLFAVFLYFADNKSRAVRRTAVQSVGWGALFLVLSLIIIFINAICATLPIIKMVVGLVLTIIHLALAGYFIFIKVKLMYNAYRGFGYSVPMIGEHIRKYE